MKLLQRGVALALLTTFTLASETALAYEQDKTYKITVLHTNDHHGHFWRNEYGEYGLAAQKTLVDGIRKEVAAEGGSVLLLSGGDINTGVPESDLQDAEPDFRGMNLVGYDAMAIGNHEFDFGLDNMARLFRMADFPVVCANYDVTGTVLEGLVKPYVVLNRNGMKIGVFGLSPKMEGLVQADKCEGIVYNDPIAVAQKIADRLRTKEGCDVVVCLSHLGFRIKNGVCDEKLAAETKGIDVILGGHSHTFMEKPAFFLNAEGRSIPVLHTGKNGIFVGELDLTLSEEE